jgi:hypothetical protein
LLATTSVSPSPLKSAVPLITQPEGAENPGAVVSMLQALRWSNRRMSPSSS